MSNNDIAKKSAAAAALTFIQEGMLIGLGTGTTSTYFIEMLAHRCNEGLKIQAVTSSIRSMTLAKKLKIPLVDINTLKQLDITVDGADEVDNRLRLIKGGGGALLREKILATMSRQMIVIVDKTKCVEKFGHYPLPVEIVPFAWLGTIQHLKNLGLSGEMRLAPNGQFFVTDNGNYIYDILGKHLVGDIEQLNESLLTIPGVIETGFFFNLASQVIVGQKDGTTSILNSPY